MEDKEEEDYEETNRRRWEVDSTVSSLPPSDPPSYAQIVRDARGHITVPLISSNPSQNTSNTQLPSAPTSSQSRNNTSIQRARHDTTNAKPQVGSAAHYRLQGSAPEFVSKIANNKRASKANLCDDRERRGNANTPIDRQRNQRHSPPKKSFMRTQWAEPAPLITAQRQLEIDNEKWKKKLRDGFLEPLEENADPYGVGYYLWSSKENNVHELLGSRLEVLDKIRLKHQVFIDWQEDLKSIRICSRAEVNHELYVIRAIKAIREAIDDVKARTISATPTYIALPPTTNSMRSIIRPRIVEDKRVTGIELAGDELTPEEASTWEQKRIQLLKNTNKRFEELLIIGMLKLAPDKGWMRLRVHFGHVAFTMIHNDFKEGKHSFANFSKMIGNSRTTGYLERQLKNAAVALNMKKLILDWPERFLPISGLISTLEDVQFKNTEILFVKLPGSSDVRLRVEAEIDKSNEEGVDEYQLGTINFFYDDRRNKRMEITMIDVEKKFDWQVEMISDNAVPETKWPAHLLSLIQSSITNKTRNKTDSLNLPYPSINPVIPPNIEVTGIVIRSVLAYKMRESGYVVELAIYRHWNGDRIHGVPPDMKAGVSMYHPAWDYETENIERSERERGWDGRLSQFFENGASMEMGGFEAFRGEVEVIQDMLCKAQEDGDV